MKRPHLRNSTPTKLNSIVAYAWEQKKNGRSESTVQTTITRLKRLSDLCNIQEPEEVKETIAKLKWQNNTKNNVIQIYDGYLKYIGKTWQRPKYKHTKSLPFIPTEKEIDALISAGTTKTATLLQILKETGARIGEVANIKWQDVDYERKTIHILAEKGSNSRILPISTKLQAMLKNLKRTNDKVFRTSKHGLRTTFEGLRKRIAIKLNNPRLNRINFHTFRHWKGTMEYHKTKDIIHVKSTLGHKSIESTMIYINIESATYLSTSDEWTCKIATNTKQASELIEAGFQFVAEKDNDMLFRKRK